MGFKLGSEKRDNLSTPYNKGRSTSVYQKKLDEGIDAEANNDGSIFIDPKIPIGSKRFERTIKHEAQHLLDMETGKSAYGDEWVMWEDKIYFRRNIDGQDVIDGPAGRLPEGHPDHPWEQSAIKAETDPNIEMDIESVEIQAVDPDELNNEKDSPNKFFGSLAKKAGELITGGGAIGMGIRALAKKRGEGGEDPCAACEASGEAQGKASGEGESNELSRKEKFMAAFGGKLGNPAWEKLQKKKANSPAEEDDIGGIVGGVFSDRRLKKDIKLVGESPSGLKIYTFKYIDGVCDNNTYEGVMSDEIPSNAVVKHSDGYDRVDYSKIDVDFKRI